jgi:hypothetical protein
MNYVYSTLANNQGYTHYEKAADGGALPREIKTIFIKGGASVAQKSGSSDVFTPHGFATPVSDEDLELLEKNYTFNLHRKNGHIKVDKKDKEIEKAVADMNRVDQSSPKVEADFPGFVVSIDTPKSSDPHRI